MLQYFGAIFWTLSGSCWWLSLSVCLAFSKKKKIANSSHVPEGAGQQVQPFCSSLECMLTSLGSESCSDTDCCEKGAKQLESLEEKCWDKLVPKDPQQTCQALGELSPDQWGNNAGWMVVYPVFGKKSTVGPGQHFVMFETCDLSHFKHCLL